MTITKAFYVGLIAVSACMAITIRGKITDTSGTPIAGASVRLEVNRDTATSASDGSFLLGTVSRINDQFSQSISSKFAISITNGLLLVELKEKTSIDVIIYNLHGQAISTVRKVMNAGKNFLILPHLGSGVFLFKVISGNTVFTLKINSFRLYSQGIEVSDKSPSFYSSFAKQAKITSAINDVIAVRKIGYLNYRVLVTAADTSGIKIRMIISAGSVTDADGNAYQSVKIGNLIWTVENLRTTKYNDGTTIPLVTDGPTWWTLTTPGYCYNNNTTNSDSIQKFGALYNWYAIDTKKLAPVGWHVSTYAEWWAIIDTLIANRYNWDGSATSNKLAISLAGKTDWEISNTAGMIGNNLYNNNKTGFSALPGGYRFFNGDFYYNGYEGIWWTSVAQDATSAVYYNLVYNNEGLWSNYSDKGCAYSVRLVKDH